VHNAEIKFNPCFTALDMYDVCYHKRARPLAQYIRFP
jgi:hypothetical protein